MHFVVLIDELRYNQIEEDVANQNIDYNNELS